MNSASSGSLICTNTLSRKTLRGVVPLNQRAYEHMDVPLRPHRVEAHSLHSENEVETLEHVNAGALGT